MKSLNHRIPSDRQLDDVVEPLASYICANDQPRAALLAALAVLVRAVRETNQVARVHFRNDSEVRSL